LAPAAAHAGGFPPVLPLPYYVNQSDPQRSDSGPCNSSAPCSTIKAALDKAHSSSSRKTVRVLPDPNGFTDVYLEQVGSGYTAPVRLVGAGPGQGGTVIQSPGGGAALSFLNDSAVSGLRVVQTADFNAAVYSAAPAFRMDNVVVDAPSGAAIDGGGTIRDSVLSGQDGVRLLNSEDVRLVRTTVSATQNAVWSRDGTAPETRVELLDCIVRGSGAPGSHGIRLDSTSGSIVARLRHVTVTGFETRVSMGFSPGTAALEAANSTLAGDGGTDLQMGHTSQSANLTATNFSPARTALSGGAAMPATVQPIDVPPGLTADGHLAPGSPLIDRGASGGALANDPDDGLDIDRQPRAQGAAPDVGADETGSAASVPVEPEDDTAGGGGGAGGGAGEGGGSGSGTGIVGDAVTGPRFALRFARSQRILRARALTVSITPEEAVALVGSATITVPRGAAATVRLKAARATGVAGRTRKLKMKLSGRGLARVRAALRRRKTLNAKVKVVATAGAGRKTTITRKLKVRR
jgi:hypothetical protein